MYLKMLLIFIEVFKLWECVLDTWYLVALLCRA